MRTPAHALARQQRGDRGRRAVEAEDREMRVHAVVARQRVRVGVAARIRVARAREHEEDAAAAAELRAQLLPLARS